MNAQTTERENTETHVFSVYISMASVKEKRARLSAQLRIRSASAAYTAFPWMVKAMSMKIETSAEQTLLNYERLKRRVVTWLSNHRPLRTHAVTSASKILGGVK